MRRSFFLGISNTWRTKKIERRRLDSRDLVIILLSGALRGLWDYSQSNIEIGNISISVTLEGDWAENKRNCTPCHAIFRSGRRKLSWLWNREASALLAYGEHRNPNWNIAARITARWWSRDSEWIGNSPSLTCHSRIPVITLTMNEGISKGKKAMDPKASDL